MAPSLSAFISTSERPTLPPLHSLDLPMPDVSKKMLQPPIHELNDPHEYYNTLRLAAPQPSRARQPSISSSVSSRMSSTSPAPSVSTAPTSPSPSPPPPSFPKVRLVLTDSWEHADAALLFPPPDAPYVPTLQAITSGVHTPNRTNGPLLLIGRALEHVRGPQRCLAKGARAHPYRLVRSDAPSRRPSTSSRTSSLSS